jgi:hypothetical protein
MTKRNRSIFGTDWGIVVMWAPTSSSPTDGWTEDGTICKFRKTIISSSPLTRTDEAQYKTYFSIICRCHRQPPISYNAEWNFWLLLFCPLYGPHHVEYVSFARPFEYGMHGFFFVAGYHWNSLNYAAANLLDTHKTMSQQLL